MTLDSTRAARYTPENLAQLLGLPAPTPQQSRVISADLRPLLVVAGAGSGKTETMTARVVYLIANELVRPEQVLGLTFTRKAAGELGVRIRRRLGQLAARLGGADDLLAGEPTISTYDAYAGRVHAEHGLRGGYEPSTRLITQGERWRIADAVVRGYSGDMSEVDSSVASVTSAVLRLTEELAAQLRTPADLLEFQHTLPELRGAAEQVQRARAQLIPLIEIFRARLEQSEMMTFGDQLGRAAALARDHTEVRAVERARYRVVLLDEYQDTSHAQFVLLHALFGDEHPVTAVGDPAQAIYGWRGAGANTLDAFQTLFETERAELSMSWRSRPGILRAANALSAPLGSAAVLRSGREDTGPAAIHCALHLTQSDEADWIADRIDRTLRAYWEDERQPTAAVLVRRRSQMAALEACLKARGLPVNVVGLGGLLDTPEVVDVCSTLRVLADPASGSALLRLLAGPRWRIGPRDIVALNRYAKELGGAGGRVTLVEALDALCVEERPPGTDESLLSTNESPVETDRSPVMTDGSPAVELSEEGHRRLRAFGMELRALRRRLDSALPDVVADVIRTMGLDVEIMARTSECSAAHLTEFADVAARFAADSVNPNLTGFLSYLDAAAQEERGLELGTVGPPPAGAVQLLTVHSAKGLEWDVVAVAGLNKGQFPDPPGKSDAWLNGLGVLPFPLRGDADDLPTFTGKAGTFEAAWKAHGEVEERRLAYVAVTRARDVLFCSGYRWSDGRIRPAEPSIFLTEIHALAEESGKESGGVEVDTWVLDPGVDNPLQAQQTEMRWPRDPLTAERRATLTEGAELVHSFLGTRIELSEEIKMLLAERDRTIMDAATVTLPDRLTVSQLSYLADDPAQLARRLRRPLPEPPARHARRGTAFHAWLEHRTGPDALLDLDELPGAADSAFGSDGEALFETDGDFAQLRVAFEASRWAKLTPYRVEVPFTTVIGDVVLRGRMDAVFRTGDGGFEIVDWKTGRVPSETAARASAVQLAAYRLAWAALAGVPLAQVGAAFHYVRPNLTVRPVDLLDADGLARLIRGVPASEAVTEDGAAKRDGEW